MPIVAVSARILSFPNMCSCCGRNGPEGKFVATATRVTGKRVIKTQERSWSFPMCLQCLEWRESVLKARTAVCIFLVMLGITFYNGLGDWAVFSISAVLSLGLGILGYKLSKHSNSIKVSTAVSITPVVYHEWNGSVHSFSLSNQNFCENFCLANYSKLINF